MVGLQSPDTVILTHQEVLGKVGVDPADPEKPLTTLAGEEIAYIPPYFGKKGVPLKPTSQIIATEGRHGGHEALLVKPEPRLIFDVTRYCSCRCPACLNAMYDATMPEATRGDKTARVLRDKSAQGAEDEPMAALETALRIRALADLGENYYDAVAESSRFVTERAGCNTYSITGGEPTLIGNRLLRLLDRAVRVDKIKLFTHGGPLLNRLNHYEQGKENIPYEGNFLSELAKRGVNELVISRHHWDEALNRGFMGAGAPTNDELKEIIRQANELGIIIRFSTMVQKGMIETTEQIAQFADWAQALGAKEVTFRALATTDAVDEATQLDPVSRYVADHRINYEGTLQAMSNDPRFQMDYQFSKHVKSRGFLTFSGKGGNMPVSLELKHDPGELETDIGVFTLFPHSDEGGLLTYRWVDPDRHAINFRGRDWTDSHPYFRKPQPKK